MHGPTTSMLLILCLMLLLLLLRCCSLLVHVLRHVLGPRGCFLHFPDYLNHAPPNVAADCMIVTVNTISKNGVIGTRHVGRRIA